MSFTQTYFSLELILFEHFPHCQSPYLYVFFFKSIFLPNFRFLNYISDKHKLLLLLFYMLYLVIYFYLKLHASHT